MKWQIQSSLLAITLLAAILATASSANAQSIRKDLPPNALPKNSVTSFHRRVVDSNEAPWRAVGRVNIGGRAHCSGTLVSEDTVLTAAHCLYSPRLGHMVVATTVHFVAGYSKGEYLGHSKVESYIFGEGFDGAAGPSREGLPHDWALLTLEEPLGATLGYLTVPDGWIDRLSALTALERNRILISTAVTTAGYPRDRAHILSLEDDCAIHATANSGHVLLTNCIGIKGDSGGPILLHSDDGWHLIGLQASLFRVNNKVAVAGVSALTYQDALEGLLP